MPANTDTPFDLIISNGTVIDGTGAQRIRSDVGIRGDRIVAMGDLGQATALRRHDASDRIVAPGFIDVHTHDDRLLLDESSDSHPKLTQGVTTVVTGNCGVSLAPLVTDAPPAPLTLLGRDAWRFDRFSDYLEALDASAPAVNAACLVGHTTLRVRHVKDLQRSALASEIDRMASDLDEALAAGAIGMSTGLYYPPAQAATAEEVIGVGAPLARHGSIVTMHIRDESDAIETAMQEALHIGLELDVDLVLSHHKLVGRNNHGRSVETLALLDRAAQHQSVCVDCYPYHASSTMLIASRIHQSDDVLITWSEPDPFAAGRSLFDLARERGVAPDALVESLSPASAVYFAMNENDVERILAHPQTMIGSDGLAHDQVPHPRLWGTFPRVLGHYARQRRLFSLEVAVHKMTGLSARRFGLSQRGTIAPGNFADLVIFDEATVEDRATFGDPMRASAGIEAVFVNGVLACEQGRSINLHAGRTLRHRTSSTEQQAIRHRA